MDATRQAFQLFVGEGQLTELRALEATYIGDRWPRTLTGYFDNADSFARAAREIRTARGVYFVPNPINPDLLARANNRLRPARKGESTQDTEIIRRRWLLIDCDPRRPSGISSSDTEHDAAIAHTRRIAQTLHERGWPEPVLADSGNGGHLMYRIDLPADDSGLVQRCLAALAREHDTDQIEIDQKVFNPARIWKLYGTRACKGDSTPDRPHRMARLLEVPERLAPVPPERLESLGQSSVVTHAPTSDERFELDAFIVRHELDVDGPHDWHGQQGAGRKWTLNTSPLCEHGGDGPYLLQHASGAISAGCHHKSCTWGWQQLRERLEPPEPLLPGAVRLAERLAAPDLVPASPPEPRDPGPIPEEMFHIPGFVDRVMQFSLDKAPYPNVGLAFCGAVALQSYLCARRVCDQGDLRPNLYLLALAASGTGKDFPRQVNARVLLEIGHLQALGDKFASGEAIQDAICRSPALLYQNDEMDSVLRQISLDREGKRESIPGTLLTLYTTANSIYSIRSLAQQKESTHVDQPHVTLFGTATPKYFYQALSERMLQNGFFARLFIIDIGKRGKGQTPGSARDLPGDIIDVANWWADFQPGDRRANLLDVHPEPKIVPHTPEAEAAYAALRLQSEREYAAAESRDDEVSRSAWTRNHENAGRFALLYACSKDHENPLIDLEAVEWASALAMHQTARKLALAAQYVAENPFHDECLKLMRKLRETPGGELPHQVLLKRMKMRAKDFKEVIKTLEESGELVSEIKATSGRSATIYRLPDCRKGEGSE